MKKQFLLASALALLPGSALAWQYDTQTDMHGTTNTASVTSDNSETLSFPWHGGPAHLTIRKHPKYGLDVYIDVPDGQIICDDYDGGCPISVKFDDGKVEQFSGLGPADHSSNIIFLQPESRFISKAKKAKTVIIELTFFQDGNHEYRFSIEGLQWKVAEAKPKPKTDATATTATNPEVQTPAGPVDDAYINDLIARLKKQSSN